MKVTEENIVEVVQSLVKAQCCPIIIPFMSTEERQALVSPPEGMIVFDTGLPVFTIYRGDPWFQWVDVYGNIIP